MKSKFLDSPYTARTIADLSKEDGVHLQKPSCNHKRNIEYLGRYLKRPPIGETRITKYDGNSVIFVYLDHYDNTKKYVTLPVMEFIGKVVSHIHDANFRCIRYFGFLANRVRGKLLPLVHVLLRSTTNFNRKFFLSWRDLIMQSFGYDPLICPNCQCTMLLSNTTFRQKINLIEWARSQIWDIYHLLVDYRQNPSKEFKQEITKQFAAFCKTKTDYQTLNLVLKRLYNNRSELLLVLKRPDIPLHNNLSERDIREYVKRRKISGSTRSDEGRDCRDTFASLKKTAIKLKIAFWDYLVDRLTKQQNIPWLPDLIIQAASSNTH